MLKKKVGEATVEFLKIPNSKLVKCFNIVSAYMTRFGKDDDDMGKYLVAFASSDEAEKVRAVFYENINVIDCGFLGTEKAFDEALERYGLAFDMQIMSEAVKHYLGESFKRVTDLVKSQAEQADTETPKAIN